MFITVEFFWVRIQSNYVLVLPDEELTQSSGIHLSRDFDPMRHVAVTGTVLGVGERLFCKDLLDHFSRGPQDTFSPFTELCSLANEFSLPWDPQDEVGIGDRVLFHYVNHLVTEEEGVEIFQDGRQLMLIPYYQLYCRLDPIEPLNGYVLIEQIHYAKESWLSARPDSTGIVRHVGRPYKRLLSPTPTGKIHPRVGQTVRFISGAPTIEYQYHQRLNPSGEPLVRVQAHEILAIVPEVL